ncbi:MAG: hypothetical protein AB7N91_01555 [Candidatus Tectimicrobiota bacterium]
MKCPKCNYVSHDYLDACRKCGIDLVAFKHEIGLMVLQPGNLDLSQILGGAGADDLFESVEEEVIMHAGDDDDFDISLDDYVDQPTARRPFATSPRAGGRPSGDDLGGMDHLTLELDAADLPPELAAHLRASQIIPDTPLTPPALPTTAFTAGEETLPGHVTLDMGRDSISAELPPELLQEVARLSPSAQPQTPPEPIEMPLSVSQETLQISRALGLGLRTPTEPAFPTEPPADLDTPEVSLPLELTSGDIAITAPAPALELPPRPDEPADMAVDTPSGPFTSLPFPEDVSLVEEFEEIEARVAPPEPEVFDPTIPTIELLDVDAAMAQIDQELQDKSLGDEDAASAMLNSFELTVDESVFALGAPTEAIEAPPDLLDPQLDTETDLDTDIAHLFPNVSYEPLLTPTAHEPSLADLDTAELEAATLTFADEEPTEPPAAAPQPPSEAMFTLSDMFALRELEEADAGVPGHLTLELQSPEQASTLVSQRFAESEPAAPPEAPTLPEAEPPQADSQFTASDAHVLGTSESATDTIPGHLTLELDISEFSDLASISLAEMPLEAPPGVPGMTSAASPGEPQAPGEEELLLDLDDFECLDEDEERR